MIADKRVIGVIPARAGSKGVPNKNIRPLCGKPLVAWTIDVALRSRLIDDLIVSTDSQQIEDIALACGARVPFLRPPELATDTASTLSVVNHALEHCEKAEGRHYDYVVLLEPTSPLRADGDIDAMLDRLHARSADFDSIVSIGEVGEHPSIMKRLVGETLVPFSSDLRMTTRRQDNEPAFFPYGVAYIVKTAALAAERTFYTRRCTYYRIQRFQNYEIDDIYDFLAVESVMRHEWNVE